MDTPMTQTDSATPLNPDVRAEQGLTLPVSTPPIPPEILRSGEIYFGMARTVQNLMVGLGLVAFIASLVVATFGDTYESQWTTKSIAFVAALATGILTLFNLPKKNQEVWAAWRMMNAAILRYQYEPGHTRKELIDTWEQAEKTLGNATINEK